MPPVPRTVPGWVYADCLAPWSGLCPAPGTPHLETPPSYHTSQEGLAAVPERSGLLQSPLGLCICCSPPWHVPSSHLFLKGSPPGFNRDRNKDDTLRALSQAVGAVAGTQDLRVCRCSRSLTGIAVFPQPPREAGLHETSDAEREMDGRSLKLQSQQMAELRSGPSVRVLVPMAQMSLRPDDSAAPQGPPLLSGGLEVSSVLPPHSDHIQQTQPPPRL